MIKNKGEILDKRMEELLKKEFPYVNNLLLEDILMKLECLNVVYVFRVSKNKNMVVLNKNNKLIKEEIMEQLR